jgi:RHS repeat-associated protein
VITGEVFTLPKTDLDLAGFFRLRIDRSYSTMRRTRNVGMGWGWTHSLAWEMHRHGRTLEVRDGLGRLQGFQFVEQQGGESTIGGWGIRRVGHGFFLRPGNEFLHYFLPDPAEPNVYRLAALSYRGRGTILLRYQGGRLSGAVDTAGRSIVFTAAPSGNIGSISVPDPSGRSIVFARYEYDQGGHLTRHFDADGFEWRYRYDDDRRLIDMQVPTGLTFHFRYDRQGRCVETWGDYPGGAPDPALVSSLPAVLADGRTKAKGVYHAKLEFGKGFSEVTDSVRVQRYFGRTDGAITKAVSATGGVTTRELDARSNEVAREDPNGAITRRTFDGYGSLLSETDAEGRTVRFAVDFEGRVVEAQDPAGGRILLRRDGDGNVESVAHQDGAVETFRYTQRGLLAEHVDARGARRTYDWDDRGNCIRITTPNGAVFQFEHDYWGREIRETMPNGGQYGFAYSDSGRIVGVVDPIGRTKRYEYDGLGNVTSETIPDGRTIRYEYGGLGWLANVVHGNGDRVERRYNREGWFLTERNENGELHEFVRDRSGRMIEERMFNGRVRRFRLDTMGRMTRMEEGSGEFTEFERNLVGQIVKRTAPDGSELSLTYDDRGYLTAAESGDVKLELRFDAVGEIVEERQTVGGRTYVVTSKRDAGGLRSLLETSLGLSLGTTRDALGDVSELRDAGGTVVRFERDLAGTFLHRQLAGGASVVDRFDAVGRLKRREVVRRGAVSVGDREPEWLGGPAPGTIYKSWEYSPINEITQVSTATDGTTELEYDVRRHLKRRRHAGIEETWSADSVSNYSETGPGAPSRVYLPGGRIAKRGDTEYDWDDRGFLVAKRRRRADGGWDRWSYAWNASDLLRQVDLPDGRRVELDYDAYARRVAKRTSTRRPDGDTEVLSSTHYVWDQEHLVHEVQLTGPEAQATRTYLFSDRDDLTPIGHREGANGPWVHYVGDHHGVPDEIVDDSGNVLGRMTRTTFGASSPAPGSRATTPFRLPGQLVDDDIGLHYNRYRYYDPETGNFISPDPIGLEGGSNLYAFGPNPIGWYDSLGLQHNMWGAAWDAQGNPIPLPHGGQYQSGERGAPDPVPPAWGARNRRNDTEQQFLRDLSAANPNGGGRAVLNGQYPPCPSCHRAMQAHAQNTGTQITYNHPGPPPQSIQYGHDPTLPPGQYPPPTGDVPPGYAQNPDGTYCNYGFGPNNRTNRPPPGCEGPTGPYDPNTAMGAYGAGRDNAQANNPPNPQNPNPGQPGNPNYPGNLF